MTIRDDRTEDQQETHIVGVVGRDRVLSGWGPVNNGHSYACWACLSEHEEAVKTWVQGRSDIVNVIVVDLETHDFGTQMGSDLHIYAITQNHPALKNI